MHITPNGCVVPQIEMLTSGKLIAQSKNDFNPLDYQLWAMSYQLYTTSFK